MKRSVYVRLLHEARPYWWHIAGIFAVSLLATPLSLLTPVPVKIVVDTVLGQEPLPWFVAAIAPQSVSESTMATLVLATGMVVAVALLHKLQGIGNWLLSTWTSQHIVMDFRTRLFRHAQKLSLAHHDTHGTHDSTFRVLWDAPSIKHVAIEGLIPFLTSLLTFAAMIVMTASISPQLALVALLVAPVVIFATRYWGTRLRWRWRDVKKLESSAHGVVQESLAAIRVVKAFGRETHEEERFTRVAKKGLRENVSVALAEGIFGLVVGVTIAIGTAAVLYVGAQQVQRGELTLGELLLVMAWLAMLYEPLRSIGKQITGLQGALASAERAFDLLDLNPDVIDKPDGAPIGRAQGTIRFEDVSFAYEKDELVLRGVDLEVPAGSWVGIAGPTGAGKSTLISLLARFYDPSCGRILLDGKDLRDYRLADLRNQFAIVLQEPVLFSASIAENIAYARPDATDEAIIAAAKAANAHDFIRALPDGYETKVGERGMRLSGGERQRISLARAFLKDAPIAILDEPTSSVDVGTEDVILEAIARLMQGRTTFTIAHRLNTLDACDIHVRIENGRLIRSEPEHLRVPSEVSG